MPSLVHIKMPHFYFILQVSLAIISYVDKSFLHMVSFGFISMIQLLRKSEAENCVLLAKAIVP